MRNAFPLLLKSTALSALLAASLGAAEFFPLAPGNTWIYRSPQDQSGLTIRVGLNLLYQGSTGKTYLPVEGYATKQLYMRADESGSLYALDWDSGKETLLTSFTDTGRAWWQAPHRVCEQEGRVEPMRIPYSGTAGRFESTLSVEYRSWNCADAGTQFEQFAENVGMLRREVMSIAGPMVYDLVFARVGSMTVAQAPSTGFLLSLRPAGEKELVADIRLTNNQGQPIKLTFPTSLDFDVVLRDPSGNPVWRYSDQLVQIPWQTIRNVTDLSFTTRIPIAPGGVPLPAGDYVVEAWLATAGGDRQFAASAAVRLEGSGERHAPLRTRAAR